MNKICHMTTVHPRTDTRILYKECQTLADNGYSVYLIVADGEGDDVYGDVVITDLGAPKNKMDRLLFFREKIFKKALEINAELYHFHDPELINIGLRLIKKGKKVIYDVHEDVPRQLLTKPYIPIKLRNLISRRIERLENEASVKFTGIIAATPLIKNRFLALNKKVIEVQNFPIHEEFIQKKQVEVRQKENSICYVGAISRVRGVINMVKAMRHVKDITLKLGGKFESTQLRDQCVELEGWEKVCEMGFLDRDKVRETLEKSIAGLVVLEPTINYLDSIPVKMFEYMAAGIPVIASDFPYWRDLLSGIDCAVFVNPEDPEEIANAIAFLAGNREKASRMGERGKKAVLEKFSWDNEKLKMLDFYSETLSRLS